MSFQCISVDEAKKLIDENNLTIIDIRDYNSYSQGHIDNAIHVENLDIDFKTNNGISWLRENLMSESVKIYNSQKKYSSDRNDDKFDLIIKGGVITNGALFKYFDQIIE